MKFPIGVIINSFRTDIPTAVKKAAKVGAQGIQVYATSGEMSPEELVGSKRADFFQTAFPGFPKGHTAVQGYRAGIRNRTAAGGSVENL